MTNQQNVCAQFAYWLRIGKFGEKEHSEAWIYDSIAFSIIQCGLAEKYAEDPLETLADLIDPTCHMSCEYGNGDDDTDEYMELIVDTPEDTVACHCHACDIVFRFERGIVPDYCPFCGARVVRDDG